MSRDLRPPRASCEGWKGVGGAWGPWMGLLDGMDENCKNPFYFCILLHTFCHWHSTTQLNAYHRTSFRMMFESRYSDPMIVSGAPNNPGIDSSLARKIVMVALEDAFMCLYRYFHSEMLDMGEWACIAGHPDVWRSAFQCSDDSWSCQSS